MISIGQQTVAQDEKKETVTVLAKKDYGYLTKKAVSEDSTIAKKHNQAWLIKSKKDKNYHQMALAYKSIMYKMDQKELLKYSDSLVYASLNSKDNDLIGKAYLTKGILFYNQKEHEKALDNYILADEYIAQTKDRYAIYKVKYSIAHTKYYLGFYDEAIALFKECLDYFEEENDLAYLSSLHSLGLCYNKINKFDLCSHYNSLGIQVSKECENLEMLPYFYHSEGVNQYFKYNYKGAIEKLTKVLPAIKKKKDFANETVAYFYIGKSYWDMHQENTAIPYFIKVDDAFKKYNYLRPDLRENYELLIDFYKKHNKAELQLHYINSLLKVDSTLNHNYKYLSHKIFKEYDTKKLLVAKQDIENSLATSNRNHYIIISSLTVAMALLSFRYRHNKKRLKKKFDELMAEKSEKEKSTPILNSEIEFDINPDLVAIILKNLEKFEKNKKYLEKDLTLTRLAALLKTNTKYASKIILKYRGKKTIEYISDLKIEHVIELLKQENKYRQYTNKALAEEVGFGSTQNFTRAFNNKAGMSPTYFIAELKKSFPL
jgi:AraC-like DNA-binding protein